MTARIVKEADLISKLYVFLKRFFLSLDFVILQMTFKLFFPECHMKEFVDSNPQYIYTYGNTHINAQTEIKCSYASYFETFYCVLVTFVLLLANKLYSIIPKCC